MLRFSISFFVFSLLAFVLGFYEVAGISADIAYTVLFVFLILSILGFISNTLSDRKYNQ